MLTLTSTLPRSLRCGSKGENKLRTIKGLGLAFGLGACLAYQPAARAQAPVGAEEEVGTTDELAAAEGDDETEIINVTGSRIKRRSIATPAPITVIGKDDILATGKATIAEVLQRLPVAANAINVQFNNGGNGASRVNLRSLGAARTLVLVNGRRFVPGGDGVNASVDLNSIPISIIERVELLKDGASAVYGSDAIAGVVNIITKRDYTGVEANAYSSISERGDARIYQFDVTGGVTSGDGRGNLIFSALVLDQQPVFAGERAFSQNDRGLDWEAWEDAGNSGGDDVTPFLFNNGSSGTPGGRIIDRLGQTGNAAWDATGCAGGACQNSAPDGRPDPFPDVGWRPTNDPQDLYNFQPENYLLTPSERLSFYTVGNYEVSDYLGFFFEGSFTSRSSAQLLAPTPLFTIVEGITVSGQNRFNPFGRDFIDVRRRMLEGGNRVFIQDSNTFRVVVGMEGAIPEIGPIVDWSWDADLIYGRTETTNQVEGLFSVPRLQQALGPDSGCTGECVPLNVFGGPGSITPEMIDYISYTGVERGFTEQYVADVNVGGPLFELFAEGNPVGVAFGYQHRREEGADIPNPLVANGETTGNARDPISGFYDLNAVYAELSAPIVSGVPGLDMLELNAAVRYVNFNTFGDNTAFKVGIRYNPVDFLALRGTISTAFRAPSVSELFSGQLDSFPNVSDPCSNVTGVGQLDNPTVAANCAADGIADGVLDPNVQILTQQGGNPNLDPETADTFTAGLVLEDSLVKGLTASVDFYNIEIDNAIQAIGANTILSQCYTQENRQFCELIQRDAGTNVITTIFDNLNNVGGFQAQGIDWDVRYTSPNFDWGKLGAGLEGTFLLELNQTQPTGFVQNFVGNYDQFGGSTGSNPEWRMNGFLRYAWQFLNGGINFRYLPSFEECEGGVCSSEDPDFDPRRRDVSDYFIADVFAGVDFSTPLGATSLTLGINNVLDVQPPFIANGFTAQSDPATFDYVGRQFYFRLNQQF